MIVLRAATFRAVYRLTPTLLLLLAGCAQGGLRGDGSLAGDGGRAGDSGSSRIDGGADAAPRRDGGLLTTDAGPRRDGGNLPPSDAGTLPLDAGSVATDAAAGCNPLTAAGCPSGDGCRLVRSGASYTTDCQDTGTFGINTPCDLHTECPAGSECTYDSDLGIGFCYAYCTNDTHCTVGLDRHCDDLLGAVIGGQQYGLCL